MPATGGLAWQSSPINGELPFGADTARCETPKRCCSSITAKSKLLKTTGDLRRACVPITSFIRPSAKPVRIVSLSVSGVSPNNKAISSDFKAPSRWSFLIRQDLIQTAVMLFCKDAGRSHQRRLSPASSNHGNPQGSNNRFPGTNIPLKQPVHRFSAGEIRPDFTNHPVLGIG